MNLNEKDISGTPMDESEKTMPLLAAGMARPEGLPEANEFDFEAKTGVRGLSPGTMMIIGLLVLAGGALYVTRVTQNNAAIASSGEAEAKVEQALARIGNPQAIGPQDALNKANISALFRDTDSIVAMFSADPSARQVPLEYVQKNPFTLYLSRAADTTVSASSGGAQDAMHLRKLREEIKTLKLQTIMGGPRPVAVINGELYQPGQKVGSFTLKGVSGMNIELESGGEVFTLTMEESGKDMKAAQPRRR